MGIKGINFIILAGSSIPRPLPVSFVEAIQQIEVTHSENERSGFQITFTAGRTGYLGRLDYPLLKSPSLRTFNRLIIMVQVNVVPQVIMDGIITNIQLNPSDQAGKDTITITGEDVGVMMDREEKIVEHPAQNEIVIVNRIVARYARYNLFPQVIPPPALDTPLPIERIPMQWGTDLAYLKQLAERYDYVFHVITGPTLFTNIAYWGPKKRISTPQRTLTVNMGPFSNVSSVQFQNDALMPSIYSAELQDRNSGRDIPVKTFGSTLLPLSRSGAVNPNVRKALLKDIAGLNYQQARARAQARTNESRDKAIIATGELDVARYGSVLQARGSVGLRGAGESYDGLYYVSEVTQTINPGMYRQSFTLTRDGTGTTVPVVRP